MSTTIRSIEDNTVSKNVFKKTNDVEGKVIRNARLARQILALGGRDVWLYDVKPNRNDKAQTCFVFENTEKFQEIFSKVLEENRKSRNEFMQEDLKRQIEELNKKISELTATTTKEE